MSRICQLTGKKAITGNNVSHSNARAEEKILSKPAGKALFCARIESMGQTEGIHFGHQDYQQEGHLQFYKRSRKEARL